VPITTKVVSSNHAHGEAYSLDTTLFEKVCQWIATGRCFATGTPVSSTNKTDLHDITEKMLKVTLNTINHTWWTLRKTDMYSPLRVRYVMLSLWWAFAG